jgi:uncharacterized protein (DUF433 family)
MALVLRDRIVVDPDVLVGKPIVRGTRHSVELVLGHLAGGWSESDILAEYSGLTHDDIIACLAYAHDVVSVDSTFPAAVP